MVKNLAGLGMGKGEVVGKIISEETDRGPSQSTQALRGQQFPAERLLWPGRLQRHMEAVHWKGIETG